MAAPTAEALEAELEAAEAEAGIEREEPDEAEAARGRRRARAAGPGQRRVDRVHREQLRDALTASTTPGGAGTAGAPAVRVRPRVRS